MMKRIALILAFVTVSVCHTAQAMHVIDTSNLAQNLVAAREAILQTQNQLQMIVNQINQYKRMLQDAMNPAQWMWGDIKSSLDQLKHTLSSLKDMTSQAGSVNAYLSAYGTQQTYGQQGNLYGCGSPDLHEGDYRGSLLQKQSADDLFKLIEEQQKALDQYSEEFEKLKERASDAEGQQEAIQAGNELASMGIQLLSQMHTLLLAQNTMFAAQVEAENDRRSQLRIGTAIKMGESPLFKKESERGGRSYTPYR